MPILLARSKNTLIISSATYTILNILVPLPEIYNSIGILNTQTHGLTVVVGCGL